jgi:hypothetical protein
MPEPAPLIINKIVSGMHGSLPRPTPTTAYVLSYSDGELRPFTRTPAMSDRIGSKYCFIVDISERYTGGRILAPDRRDVAPFQIQFDASWYVSNPVEVVRRNTTDGDTVVRSYLSDTIWPLARNHSPGDPHGVEDEILHALRTPRARV